MPLRDETGRAVLSKDRLTLTTASDKLLADVSGLTNLGIVQVAKAGSATGVVYRTVGPVAPDSAMAQSAPKRSRMAWPSSLAPSPTTPATGATHFGPMRPWRPIHDSHVPRP